MIRSIAAALVLFASMGCQDVFARGGGARGGERQAYHGMPSDGGFHSMSSSHSRDGYTVDRGVAEGPHGGVAAGASVTGPRGNTADRGAAEGPRGGVAAGDSATGSRGNTFERGAAEGPRGGVAAGDSATGSRGNTFERGAAVGPNGGAVAGRSAVGAEGGRATQAVAAGPRGGVAAAGVARGPEGAVAGRGVVGDRYGAVGGFGYASPSGRYEQAYGVRTGFAGQGLYTPGWYGAHPGAWGAAGVTGAAWTGASWGTMNGWLGTNAAPVYYNYGSNVVAQDDNVYFNDQNVGTTQAYYEQAAAIANTGAAPATPTDDQNWLPLGVFAMTHGGQANSHMVIQLAVDKQGIIRGNFTDTKTNQTLPVQGAIDKQTQRAAWTIGDKQNDVLDTGAYNLTKDEVPALLHYGKDRTEQWLLVRVTQQAPRPSQN